MELRIVRFGNGEFRKDARRFEFVGIELQFRVIGISGRIIGVRVVPISARERIGLSVDVDERPRKCGPAIVDDVIPRRIPGNCRF